MNTSMAEEFLHTALEEKKERQYTFGKIFFFQLFIPEREENFIQTEWDHNYLKITLFIPPYYVAFILISISNTQTPPCMWGCTQYFR